MKKILTLALTIVMLGSILAGCGNSKEDQSSQSGSTDSATPKTITVTHALGTTEVPVNPKKVAVLDYSILDTIDALGVSPELMLAKDAVPKYIQKYEGPSYKDGRDVKDPDMEAINDFKPDLIIIGSRQASLYNEFSAIAPTIYTAVDNNNFWDDFVKINTTIGEIFDKKDVAEKKIADIKTKVDSITATSSKLKDKKALAIQTNDGSLSAFGPGSRFGIIYGLLGITPVDANIEVSTHGASIGFEYIAEKNPDYLFDVDRTVVVGGTSYASDTLNNELVKNTNAGKNNKIIYLDPGTWYLAGYGLESLPLMLDEVANAIK